MDMRLRRIENEMLRFIDDSVAALNSGLMTFPAVKKLHQTIEKSVTERDGFEQIAPPELLSPLYFETSAALDTLREHVASAIKRYEADHLGNSQK